MTNRCFRLPPLSQDICYIGIRSTLVIFCQLPSTGILDFATRTLRFPFCPIQIVRSHAIIPQVNVMYPTTKIRNRSSMRFFYKLFSFLTIYKHYLC